MFILQKIKRKLSQSVFRIGHWTNWVGIVFIMLAACSHLSKQESPEGYTLTWLGTAGWKLSYKDKTILIDPYLSRKSVANKEGKEDFNQIWASNADSIEFALKSAQIANVDHIFVSHSHFDHFGDVPYLVQKFPNATVFGSLTTCNILAASHPSIKCFDISVKNEFKLSNISVRIVPTLHSLIGPLKKVPFAGSIESPPKLPLKVSDYLEGGSYMFYFMGEGINFLFQGSANFVENELKNIHPKTAVMAPAMYGNVERYQEKFIGKLRPKRVLLNHFDNFYLPYSAGIVPLNKKELDQFVTELKALDSTIELTVPRFFQEIRIQD